ncbi:hypothetical protein [Microbacterium sp. Mcb102]|uniref:hypothetical protein n=1 Tax=Microbacterium sp. Mcb102 TaxID=2926012 RepID=UPI0021C988DE|nr:hypothetical protein [Microbacterium sp. Mcb102]
MTVQRTFVSEDAFSFVTEIDRRDVPLFVAVHWTGVRFTPGDDFTQGLRKFLTTRPEVSEVWFVFPSDMVDVYEQLRTSDRFTFGGTGIPQEYRFFAVGHNGRLTEKFRPRTSPLPRVVKSVESDVLAEGLRQIFRDTDSLAAAAAGFHFTHPSGKHSKYFIRASQAVSRVQHAYYVAWAMLRTFPECTDESTLWIDTAAISAAAYAYMDLQRRLGAVSIRRVETFGGYSGMAAGLHPAVEDLVLISGSTSGSLSRHVVGAKNVPSDRVATLFYLAEPVWPNGAGKLICDMSDRDPEAFPTIRQSRIRPYDAHDAEECEICDRGSGTIALAGDSFFPAGGELDLRMPSFIDRPLGALEGRERLARMTEFDGSTYFSDLLGSGVIAFPDTPSPHGVTTLFGDVLTAGTHPHIVERIIEAAEAAVAEDEPVAAVISLVDPDSTALGQLLADHFIGASTDNNLGETEALRREWRTAGAATLAEIGERTVLVVAAVVGSGRALTAISRELRKEAGDFHPEYFVAAAHPESSTAWTILTRTLERQSSDKTTNLAHIWRLPREPRFPGALTPWAREADVLDQVGGWLAAHPPFSALAPALEPRLHELNRLDSNTLFVGALHGSSIEQLNADFALWPFDWTDHDSGAVPSHAEIYATVAHLLYESRRRNSRMDGRVLTSRRHGYALNPALFDRFNDPVIQAAVIRAAEPGELNYEADDDASHAVADVLWFVLDNIGTEAGGAAYEFLLALCEGRQETRAAGIRISDRWRRVVLDEVAKRYGSDFVDLATPAPHLRALLIYLRDA